MQKNLPEWPDYDPATIEGKRQQSWEEMKLHLAQEQSEKPKYYCLDFFPYPSGEGLHVGHCRNYVPTDVISRYKRLKGFNVLHPMGWDAFGEPTEQYAISHGVHPRITTDRNTANFRRQMEMVGLSYDWSREIDSSKPEYYRWNQWFFRLLYQMGLAYRDTNWQWWCPQCQTTLSSHEIVNGICWRGHTGVIRKEIPAWYFRITAYADELISGLEEVDWPEPLKAMQRNWIGRSEGCEVLFQTESGASIPVFTTRADTIFGVTFFVLAPEHPMVRELTTANQLFELEAYLQAVSSLSEVERMSDSRIKTGVFTGNYVTNPINHERIPVWVADYVLPGYGTGAIMGVPAHDKRDWDFAQRNGLPIKQVIIPAVIERGQQSPVEVFSEMGILINSQEYSGMDSLSAIKVITSWLEDHELGGFEVNYRMRDWLISRQRYWGTPIPMVYCDQCGEVLVPEDELPVLLPDMIDFAPDGSGQSPLARDADFVRTQCPTCGGMAVRETDTMGGFACSSWYFLRYTSPHFEDGPFKPESVRYWMPVDLYVGGAEHAVLHLLYARFWTKVLADAKLLKFREPFLKLINQGHLLGADGLRMSKSRGNVITPDSVVSEYGADALRIYGMFMAPFEQDVSWNTEGIVGARRFINRVWSLYADTYYMTRDAKELDQDLQVVLHQTIRKVTVRIEEFRFNTMVSTLMEFLNVLVDRHRNVNWHTYTFHTALDVFMLLLAPSAPFLADELWNKTGHEGSIFMQSWPTWDDDLAVDVPSEIALQINGKLRDVMQVESGMDKDEVFNLALRHPKVESYLEGRTVEKFFFVPDRVLNIVTTR